MGKRSNRKRRLAQMDEGGGSHKLYVEFDSKARREYVLGMSKRRQERKQQAIDQLESKVKEEKRLEREQRRNEMREQHEKRVKAYDRQRRLREEINETSSSEDEEEQQTESALKEMTGLKSTTEKIEVNDEFSNKMFGSSVVTITTTKLNDDDEENNEEQEESSFLKKSRKPAAPGSSSSAPLLMSKNMGHDVTRSEKLLQQLKQKRANNRARFAKGAKKTKIGAKERLSKRRRGKTSAKERRKRS